MQHRVFALLSGSLVLAACAAPVAGEGDGSTSSLIIGGSTDSNDPAIVEFIMSTGGDGYDMCTATFISQTVLLTAAHCVYKEGNHKTLPAKAVYSVSLAPNARTAKKTDKIAVSHANVHPHPGYDGNGAHDVAIITLDQPVNVTPIPIGRTALTQADVGKRIRLVGYGQSTANGSDTTERKRTVTTGIMSLQGDLVGIGSTNGQACNGDSGGPALLSINGVETLIATDDLAAGPVNCKGGDLYQRVDLHLDFIDPFLGGAPVQVAGSPDGLTNDGTTSDPSGNVSGGATNPDPCANPADPSYDPTVCGGSAQDG